MRGRKFMLAIAGVGALTFMSACSPEGRRAEQREGTTGERVGTTERAENAKDALVRDMEARIDRLEEQIDRYRDDAGTRKGGKTDAQYKQAKMELESKKDLAAKKLNELKDAGAENWQNFRAGVEQAINDLEQHYNQFAARWGERREERRAE